MFNKLFLYIARYFTIFIFALCEFTYFFKHFTVLFMTNVVYYNLFILLNLNASKD